LKMLPFYYTYIHIYTHKFVTCNTVKQSLNQSRVTTHLENLENLDKSGNSKVVREKSGKWKKSGKSQRK